MTDKRATAEIYSFRILFAIRFYGNISVVDSHDPIAEAKAYAQWRYQVACAELWRRHARIVERIRAKHNPKEPTGPELRRLFGNAYAELQIALILARVDALIAGFDLHEVTITDGLSDFIMGEAKELNARYMCSVRKDASDAANLGPDARPVLRPVEFPEAEIRCKLDEWRLKRRSNKPRVRATMPREEQNAVNAKLDKLEQAQNMFGVARAVTPTDRT